MFKSTGAFGTTKNESIEAKYLSVNQLEIGGTDSGKVEQVDLKAISSLNRAAVTMLLVMWNEREANTTMTVDGGMELAMTEEEFLENQAEILQALADEMGVDVEDIILPD
jgi:hypothetical protein